MRMMGRALETAKASEGRTEGYFRKYRLSAIWAGLLPPFLRRGLKAVVRKDARKQPHATKRDQLPIVHAWAWSAVCCQTCLPIPHLDPPVPISGSRPSDPWHRCHPLPESYGLDRHCSR